jgi:hypothetical protein
MQRALFILCILGLGLMIGGCGQKANDNSSGNGRGRDGKVPGQGETEHKCKVSSILEILPNAQTAFVLEQNQEQALWNIDQRIRLNQFNYPNRYYKIGYSGKYIIEKISNDAFTVRKNVGDLNHYVIRISSRDRTSLALSSNERYLVVRYKSTYSRYIHRVSVFELATGKIVFTKRFSYVRHVALDETGKKLILGIDDNVDKEIQIWDWSSGEMQKRIELLRYLSFTKMSVSKDTIVIKMAREYFGFNMKTGERTFNDRFNYLYRVTPNGNVGLFAKTWDEVELIDLTNGSKIQSRKSPDNIFVSTCQIRSDGKSLICKDQYDPSKLIRWNLQDDSKKAFCL